MMFLNSPGMAAHTQRQMGMMGNPATNPVSRPATGQNPKAYAQALRQPAGRRQGFNPIPGAGSPSAPRVKPRPAFLSAKEIDYKSPGSVASHYGWNPNTIDRTWERYANQQGTENQRNIYGHATGYLGRQGTSFNQSQPDQRISALDYAFREEARRQQTKKPGLLGGVLGTVLTAGLGAVNPALGIASGLAQSGGNPLKVGASFIPSPVKFRA